LSHEAKAHGADSTSGESCHSWKCACLYELGDRSPLASVTALQPITPDP